MPSKETGRLRLYPLLIGFAVLVAVVFSALWHTVHQVADMAALHDAMTIHGDLADVFTALQDAETGQRGFLLTGRAEYLVPYNEAVASLDGRLEVLAKKMADHPAELPMLSSLRAVTEQKLAELKTTVDLKTEGRDAEALAIVNADVGKAAMDRVRKIMERIKAEEDNLVNAREDIAKDLAARVQVGVAVAALLIVVLGGLVFATFQRQLRTLATARDDLRLANDRLLQEAHARESISEQLRQAQKMEAVGQLTGGIAHDFNNMLAIVIGSLNLVRRRLGRGQTADIDRFIVGALDGAERAATLTSRLLAFSRQQALAPEPVDPNKFVAGISDLLRRSLGETVQLETVLAGGLWRAHADANQLENAVLNLCINARDAMPDGGRLTIETQNAYLDEAYCAKHIDVSAGQYVLIAITDTGAGMSAEVIAKAFDPFFTTKSVGKGTGLGLSQVFGFVRQTGGHVKIYSEVGQGTTIKLYLPRFTGAAERAPAPDMEPARAAGSAREIVLVVEDEERVREMTVESLRELGYTVRQAEGAAAALRILDAEAGITLLFTDIVMPDVNGRKLADEARRRNPHLKVLYTTGYTRNAIVHNGVLDAGVNLITKPFAIEALASKIREVLDQA